MRRPEPFDRGPPGFGSRLLWFAGLWVAGVAVVAALAYALRWAITP